METDDLVSKLSRKVAELAMVIDVLFKKTHEKEQMLEQVGKRYDEEMTKCADRFRTRIKMLEEQVKDYNDYRAKVKPDLVDLQHYKLTVGELKESLAESKERMKKMAIDIDTKDKEIAILKEALYERSIVHENHDTDSTERSIAEADRRNSQLHTNVELIPDDVDTISKKYEDEILQLKVDNLELKEKLTSQRKTTSKEINDLKVSLDTITKEQRAAKEGRQKLVKERDNLKDELKKVEQAKAKLNSKLRFCQERMQVSLKADRQRKKSSGLPVIKNEVPTGNIEQELCRLREEVERYKMELINREDNYNKVFKERQHVLRTDCVSLQPLKTSWNLTGVSSKETKKGQLPRLLLQ